MGHRRGLDGSRTAGGSSSMPVLRRNGGLKATWSDGGELLTACSKLSFDIIVNTFNIAVVCALLYFAVDWQLLPGHRTDLDLARCPNTEKNRSVRKFKVHAPNMQLQNTFEQCDTLEALRNHQKTWT